MNSLFRIGILCVLLGLPLSARPSKSAKKSGSSAKNTAAAVVPSVVAVVNPLTEEKLEFPHRVWSKIAPLMSELQTKLGAWEYSMLLQSVDDWCKGEKIYTDDSVAKLYDKLAEISAEPQKFPRIRMSKEHAETMAFTLDFQENADWVFYGDSDCFVSLGGRQGEAIYTFWDARTCRQLAEIVETGESDYYSVPNMPIRRSDFISGAYTIGGKFCSFLREHFSRTVESELTFSPFSGKVYGFGVKQGDNDEEMSGWDDFASWMIENYFKPLHMQENESAVQYLGKHIYPWEWRLESWYWEEESIPTPNNDPFWISPYSGRDDHFLSYTLADGTEVDLDLNRLSVRQKQGPRRGSTSYDALPASPKAEALKTALGHYPQKTILAKDRERMHQDVAVEADAEDLLLFSIPLGRFGLDDYDWYKLMGLSYHGQLQLLPPLKEIIAAKENGMRVPLIPYDRNAKNRVREDMEASDICGESRMMMLMHDFCAMYAGSKPGYYNIIIGEGENVDFLELDATGGTISYLCRMQHFSGIPTLFISDKKLLLLPESRNSYKVLNVAEPSQAEFVANLYLTGRAGYAVVLPNGHYACSPACERFLSIGDGQTRIGISPLAPWYNRPHEVLEALEGQSDDIAALRETTRRWLRKNYGMDMDAMPEAPALSDFPQVSMEKPSPLVTHTPQTETAVCVKAHTHPVTKLAVRVEGAEIAAPDMPEIPAGESRVVTVEIPLSVGQNWVEITPYDSVGYAGDTLRYRVVRQGDDDAALYVVALGVSQYRDSSLNLQYAAKDATDLCAALEKYGKGRVNTLLLTDEQVTPDALAEVRSFLAPARGQDRVLLYVAGHGMLDESLTYHFAPHGFDTEKVKETGIDIDTLLERCLSECAARKRLLVLDTCHSGSLGEADLDKLAANGTTLPHGVRAIANRGMKVKNAATALRDSQKKRYIEEMFSMSSAHRGVSIMAASSGSEFALESSEWNNGVFTACILKALKGDLSADMNFDGTLTAGELQRYVQVQVAEMTGGVQKVSVVEEGDGDSYAVAVNIVDALNSGDLNKAERLLKEGASADDRSAPREASVLMCALKQHAPIELLKIIIQRGANRTYSGDVHSKNGKIEFFDWGGNLYHGFIDEDVLVKLGYTPVQVKELLRILPKKDDAQDAEYYANSYDLWSAEQFRKEGGRLSDAGQDEEALEMIECAARRGDSTAQRWLGFRYLNGRGVVKDKSRAALWFMHAAEQGDAAAAEALRANGLSSAGAIKGSSSTSDPYAGWSAERLRKEGGRLSDAGQQTQALQLIMRAAEAGDSTAQRWLGFRYLNGRGVAADKSSASYWFKRAADQGDSAAAEALRTNGLSNSGAVRGSSSSSDPYAGWSAAQLRAEGGRLSDAGKQTEALQLIKRAANAGDSTAQRWLGFRYLNGRGVPKDKNQAKYWLGQAAGQGDSAAAAALKDIR